jgi:hypothetical protein
MELLEKYWWIVLIAVAGVLLLNRSGGNGSLTTVSGGSDQAALAAIASQERQADEANRVGLIGGLLNFLNAGYDRTAAAQSEHRNNLAQLNIARLNADSATTIAQYQAQNAQSAYNANIAMQELQNRIAQAQINANLAIARRQGNSQNLNSILQAILGGFSILQPTIFGNSGGSGGFGGFQFPTIGGSTPSWNPNSGGGWGFGLNW